MLIERSQHGTTEQLTFRLTPHKLLQTRLGTARTFYSAGLKLATEPASFVKELQMAVEIVGMTVTAVARVDRWAELARAEHDDVSLADYGFVGSLLWCRHGSVGASAFLRKHILHAQRADTRS